MKKLLLVLVLLISVFATSVFAQKLAILKPTKEGGTSDAIPLDKKTYNKLLKNEIKLEDLKIFEATHNGIIDTLRYGSATNTSWGIAVGDTNVMYYNPPAACYIKSVGIIAGQWGTSDPMASGYNLMLHKAAYGYDWPADKLQGAGLPITSELGLPTIIGAEMWGAGGFPVTIENGVLTFTDMIFLGIEPDSEREGFFVTVVPYGDAAAYMGTHYWGSISPDNDDDSGRTAKYYQGGWGGFPPQFVVRHFSCAWIVVVEFYENTGPTIALDGAYGSVLSADQLPIRITARDIDANDPAQAGVAKAEMFYSINDGPEQMVAMSLVEGTDTDGMWEGVLPAGYMNPGDVCSFRFEATDKPGLMTSLVGGSFGYFVKTAEILFYYNDNSFSVADAKAIYWNQVSNYQFDTWDGVADGATQAILLDMYNWIVRVDGFSPINLDAAVFEAWLASGTDANKKHVFWSSQEFLGAENGWVNTTYAADDWHNMYLGISAVNHDLQYSATGATGQAWPVDAVLDDPLTGKLAKFCADSSFQLLHYPDYELGGNDWSDHVEPGEGASVCFKDHASGVSMGVYKDGGAVMSVFLGLDQAALDINPPYVSPPTYPRYVWPEYGFPSYAAGLSVIEPTLKWFNAPTAVNENVAPGVITDYSLSQNYPNPFNPETKISFSIAKAGKVSLAVYNVVGQKVADLVNEQKVAGKYQVTWNANSLASGVYFYRLEVGDYSKTMKMMLLR